MASIFSPKVRHVLPNFRSFEETVALGEIAPSHEGVQQPLPMDFADLLSSWRNHPSIGVAGDVLSNAIVAGRIDHREVSDAAEFILAHQEGSSAALVDAARELLNLKPASVSVPLPRLDNFLAQHRAQITYRQIHKLKQAAIRFGEDPIVHTELARLYLIQGDAAKAIRSMRIALALAPNNRFVLRSAARMYAHLDDAEMAYDLLSRNPRTPRDPWLTSAQLAVAGLVGQEKRVVKRGMSLVASGNHSPFSLSELQSGLGSVELLHGDRKRSRRLLQASLAEPNDNVLAQTEWALSRDRLFEFDPQAFDVERNYEAFALEAFNREQWDSVLEHCESWFMDMPFSRRPLMMGAHVATVVLDDFVAGQKFCQAGLVGHQHDPALLNNLAYALALDGKADEAIKVLDQVPLGSIEPGATQACLTATRGLALFRKGQVEEGRKLYLEAMEAAKEVPDVSYRQLAVLNYIREEVLAKQPVPDSVIATVKGIKISPTSPTIEIFRQKVLALLEGTESPKRDTSDVH